MPFDAENTKKSENFKSSTLIFVRLFFSFTISFLHLLSPLALLTSSSAISIFAQILRISKPKVSWLRSYIALFFFAGFWIYEEGKPVICGNGTAARYGIY